MRLGLEVGVIMDTKYNNKGGSLDLLTHRLIEQGRASLDIIARLLSIVLVV